MTTRRLKLLNLSATAAVLAGCVTVEPVPLPNGQQGFAIEQCGTLADCYKKAAEVCGGKYEIVGQASGSSGSMSNNIGVVDTTYSLTVACPSDSATPK